MQATDVLGISSVPSMGVGRGKGGFGMGKLITPPLYPPSPGAFFFRGGTKGRGVEGGPTMPASPPPPPPLHPDALHAPGAARPNWEEKGGGAGTGHQRPLPPTNLRSLKPPYSPHPHLYSLPGPPLKGLLRQRVQAGVGALGGLAVP